MEAFAELVARTPWADLEDPHGESAAGFGEWLPALLSEERPAREAALRALEYTLLRDFAVHSATLPGMRALSLMLADPRSLAPISDLYVSHDPEEWPTGSLRRVLLGAMEVFGQVCQFDETSDAELMEEAYPFGPDASDARLADLHEYSLSNLRWSRNLLACRATAPETYAAVAPFFDDPDEETRTRALNAAGWLTGHPDLAPQRPALLPRIEHTALTSPGPERRAMSALLIGLRGGRPEALLTDPHPGVRAHAALAPAFTTDPRAFKEILAALKTPAEARNWFPMFSGQEEPLLTELTQEAIKRTPDFETLLPAALAIAPVANPRTPEYDWGPLLLAAFPTPYDGGPLSPAQRAYLSALVDREALWKEDVLNRQSLFTRVGLPLDREECRTLAS